MTEQKKDSVQNGDNAAKDKEAADLFIKSLQGFVDTGCVLRNINGISDSEMEMVYAMGYNFYRAARLDDAAKVFKFLCLFDHLTPKYWIGMGAVQQLQKDYKAAVVSYGYASMLDLKNPKPQLHSAECFLAMGDVTNAISALEALLAFCPDDTADGKKYRAKAEALKKVIDAKVASMGK